MSTASTVDELKQAILTKANDIADEYHARAKQARTNVLSEARERLHLREEHETEIGRHIADKEYARRIQANELKLQRKLDMLRWSLVESIMASLKKRFIDLSEKDPERYLAVLGEWAGDACKMLGHDELIAELNIRDAALLKENWDRFVEEYIPDSVNLTLATTPCETIGGIRIRTPDNMVRIDNCYEGRMQRLEPLIKQSIMHKLFSTVEQLQRLIHS